MKKLHWKSNSITSDLLPETQKIDFIALDPQKTYKQVRFEFFPLETRKSSDQF